MTNTKTICIFGGNGGVGSSLINILSTSNYKIINIDLENSDVNTDLLQESDRKICIDKISEITNGYFDSVVFCSGGHYPMSSADIVSLNYYAVVEMCNNLKKISKQSFSIILLSSATISQIDEDFKNLAKRYLSSSEESTRKSLSKIFTSDSMNQYIISKMSLAFWGVIHSVDQEWLEKKIRINILAPGVLDTKLTKQLLAFPDGSKIIKDSAPPIKRFGKPHEVAKLIEFLISDDASFINGSVFYIDGGMSAANFVNNNLKFQI